MEQIGLDHAEVGRKVLIVRPFNVVGPRQISEHGMVVPSFIRKALINSPLIVYGDGSQTRCFSCVDTFVRSVLSLLQYIQIWDLGKNIINVGTEEKTSINQLANEIISQTNSSSIIEYMPYDKVFKGQIDVQERVPDTTLLRKYLGNLAWPSIKTVISELINEKVNSIYEQS
jgi:UDP-glucose 4-epimerase